MPRTRLTFEAPNAKINAKKRINLMQRSICSEFFNKRTPRRVFTLRDALFHKWVGDLTNCINTFTIIKQTWTLFVRRLSCYCNNWSNAVNIEEEVA